MRHPSHPLKVLIALAFSLACAGSAGEIRPGPDSVAPPDGEIASFVPRLNDHREAVGCDALVWHAETADVAQAHSQDMQDRSFSSHVNPDGELPWDRLAAGGVTWNGPAAENIAQTSGGAESALENWLDSSGHRANIENCTFTHHGVGLTGSYWTHVFITNPD